MSDFSVRVTVPVRPEEIVMLPTHIENSELDERNGLVSCLKMSVNRSRTSSRSFRLAMDDCVDWVSDSLGLVERECDEMEVRRRMDLLRAERRLGVERDRCVARVCVRRELFMVGLWGGGTSIENSSSVDVTAIL